jgi:hypothetical protein
MILTVGCARSGDLAGGGATVEVHANVLLKALRQDPNAAARLRGRTFRVLGYFTRFTKLPDGGNVDVTGDAKQTSARLSFPRPGEGEASFWFADLDRARADSTLEAKSPVCVEGRLESYKAKQHVALFKHCQVLARPDAEQLERLARASPAELLTNP